MKKLLKYLQDRESLLQAHVEESDGKLCTYTLTRLSELDLIINLIMGGTFKDEESVIKP